MKSLETPLHSLAPFQLKLDRFTNLKDLIYKVFWDASSLPVGRVKNGPVGPWIWELGMVIWDPPNSAGCT